jgi:hypothetical protein
LKYDTGGGEPIEVEGRWWVEGGIVGEDESCCPDLAAERDENVGESGWDEADFVDGDDSTASRRGPEERFDLSSGESSDSEDEIEALRSPRSRPFVAGDKSGGDSKGGGE